MNKKTNLETGDQRKTFFDFDGRFQFLLFVGCQNNKKEPTCSGSKSCTQTQFNLFIITKQKIFSDVAFLTRSTKSKEGRGKKFLKHFVRNICCYFIIGKEKASLVHITNSIDELKKSNSGALHNSQSKWKIVNINLKCHSNFHNSNLEFFVLFNFQLFTHIRFSILALTRFALNILVWTDSSQQMAEHTIFERKKKIPCESLHR